MRNERPLRYRGIRSQRAQRAVKAVFVAAGFGTLVLIGVARAIYRADTGGQSWSTPIIVAIGILWAVGIALGLRALARGLLADEHDPGARPPGSSARTE
jgi:hypothetical protein